MKSYVLAFVAGVAVLSALLILTDGLALARAAWRRRRTVQDGAYGVVVDRSGHVLGVYLDPYAHPWQAARRHGPGTPWTTPDTDETWAWEGFGETEDSAYRAANRLRRLHLLQTEHGRAADDGDFRRPGG